MTDPLGFWGDRPICARHPIEAHKIRDNDPAPVRENYGGKPQKSIDKCTHCPLPEWACGGQGAKARSIGYTVEATPTLKSAPSGGNTVPCVFENHGQDCRLTGPPDVTPTVGRSRLSERIGL